MKKAVITGCTGVVGISLIEELLKNGWKVLAVPRENSSRIKAIPNHRNIQIIPCNLENLKKLPQKVEEEYDVFFHFAWDGTYGEDRIDCTRQNRNVESTICAVEVAHKIGCKVFIGAGSQSECGHIDGVLTPDVCCMPDNPYGAAKLSACHMSRIRCNQLGIRHNWCRILSMYGSNDGKYTMVMSLIGKLLNGEKPLCTNGDQIWDYIYNKDAAKAFRLVAEKGKENAIYCFGSGKTKQLKEYIEIIRNSIDENLEIGFGEIPYYPNQVMHLEADITSLKADTGFDIEYSFEDGIKETIQWYKENYLE